MSSGWGPAVPVFPAWPRSFPIATGEAISNCTFGGPDGRTLFMTSTHAIASLPTKVRGAPTRVPKIAERAK